MYRAALQVIAVSVIAITGMKRRSITMQIIWYYSAACTLCTVRNPVPITMSTLQVFFCGTEYHPSHHAALLPGPVRSWSSLIK